MRPVVEDDIEERGSIGVDILAGVDGFSVATDRRALCHAWVDVFGRKRHPAAPWPVRLAPGCPPPPGAPWDRHHTRQRYPGGCGVISRNATEWQTLSVRALEPA